MALQANYTKMLNDYTSGKYKSAIKEGKSSYDEYNNPKLHLLWAKSAQKLGHTTEAMSAYERVLILEPNNQEALLALDTIYEQSQRMGLDTQTTQGDNKLKVRANIALGYDSNINVNPGGDALDDYFGVVGSQGKLGTKFLRFSANLAYTYHFENAEGWFVKGIVDFYNQSNFSAHFYDLRVGTIEAALGYENDSYRLYLPLRYSTIHYLDKNLLAHYEFLPRLTFPIWEDSFLDVNAIYRKRAYKDSIDDVNDAKTLGLGVGLYFPIYGDRAHIHLQYEKRSSTESIHTKFVDANFIRLDASLQHYFSPKVYAEATYLYRYGDYSDNIGTILVPNSTKRTDNFNQIDLTLNYVLSKDYTLYLRDTYAKNNSKFIPNEYSKNVIMFGINMTY
jgi:tetratricopeptide (TPR) repeat protein